MNKGVSRYRLGTQPGMILKSAQFRFSDIYYFKNNNNNDKKKNKSESKDKDKRSNDKNKNKCDIKVGLMVRSDCTTFTFFLKLQ